MAGVGAFLSLDDFDKSARVVFAVFLLLSAAATWLAAWAVRRARPFPFVCVPGLAAALIVTGALLTNLKFFCGGAGGGLAWRWRWSGRVGCCSGRASAGPPGWDGAWGGSWRAGR